MAGSAMAGSVMADLAMADLEMADLAMERSSDGTLWQWDVVAMQCFCNVWTALSCRNGCGHVCKSLYHVF